MLEYGDGPVVRYADQDGKWLREAMTAASSRRLRGLTVVPPVFDVAAFYREEGVVAVFNRGRHECRTRSRR
jgi:hypothetical protein